jgi:hypothetical protein
VLTFQPRKPFRRRARAADPSPPPPRPLTLVSASFDVGLLILRLGFDRPIDISGLIAGPFVVNDHDTDTQYGGQGSGVLIDPTTLDVEMTEIQSMGFPDTRLFTTGPTGIVAADDGGTWAGVMDLLLPFP